ncbi:MAG: protein-L-isoaspartate(D-aspartate) O-methyltransferase [Arenicellales bacterium]
MKPKHQRIQMVERQLAARDISDPLVLSAMGRIQREKFVSADYRSQAYHDGPLPIGYRQTISQPYIVALMTQALRLKGGENVLEIGTGSGYAAAVLAEIAGKVTTIEFISELAQQAERLLSDLGYDNISVIHGDGTLGYSPNAPYDAIVVTAGGPEVPESLKQQLKTGGRLVIPVGATTSMQSLLRVTREDKNNFSHEDLCGVRFVPLVGEEGWPVE